MEMLNSLSQKLYDFLENPIGTLMTSTVVSSLLTFSVQSFANKLNNGSSGVITDDNLLKMYGFFGVVTYSSQVLNSEKLTNTLFITPWDGLKNVVHTAYNALATALHDSWSATQAVVHAVPSYVSITFCSYQAFRILLGVEVPKAGLVMFFPATVLAGYTAALGVMRDYAPPSFAQANDHPPEYGYLHSATGALGTLDAQEPFSLQNPRASDEDGVAKQKYAKDKIQIDDKLVPELTKKINDVCTEGLNLFSKIPIWLTHKGLSSEDEGLLKSAQDVFENGEGSKNRFLMCAPNQSSMEVRVTFLLNYLNPNDAQKNTALAQSLENERASMCLVQKEITKYMEEYDTANAPSKDSWTQYCKDNTSASLCTPYIKELILDALPHSI